MWYNKVWNFAKETKSHDNIGLGAVNHGSDSIGTGYDDNYIQER